MVQERCYCLYIYYSLSLYIYLYTPACMYKGCGEIKEMKEMEGQMDGCRRHGVISTTALDEWARVEAVVAVAVSGLAGRELRAERNAQAGQIVVCHCCMAPSTDWRTVLCPTCAAPGGCGCEFCKVVTC